MAEDDPTPGFECIDKAMLRARRQVVLMSRRHRAVLCLAVTAAAWLLFSAPSYLFGRRCSRSMPRIFSHRGFDASEALYEVTSQRSLRDLLDGGLRSFDLDLFWTAHDPEGTPHPTPNPRHGWPPLPPHAPRPDLVSGRHNVRGPPAHSAAAVAPACRPRAHATRGAARAPRGEAPLAAGAAPPPQATTARARPGAGASSFGAWGVGRVCVQVSAAGMCACADLARAQVPRAPRVAAAALPPLRAAQGHGHRAQVRPRRRGQRAGAPAPAGAAAARRAREPAPAAQGCRRAARRRRRAALQPQARCTHRTHAARARSTCL